MTEFIPHRKPLLGCLFSMMEGRPIETIDRYPSRLTPLLILLLAKEGNAEYIHSLLLSQASREVRLEMIYLMVTQHQPSFTHRLNGCYALRGVYLGVYCTRKIIVWYGASIRRIATTCFFTVRLRRQPVSVWPTVAGKTSKLVRKSCFLCSVHVSIFVGINRRTVSSHDK